MQSDLGEIILYQAEDGSSLVDVRLRDETVWLTLNQMAELFGRDKSVISRHLRNIFQTGELVKESVVAKNATTAADGKTYQVDWYNLDAIISVGYRVNSKRGTRFRIWATSVLKDHPFSDGNKRIGAFLFLLFLGENRLGVQRRFSNNALVPLILLIAASDPGQKEILVRLITHLITGE